MENAGFLHRSIAVVLDATLLWLLGTGVYSPAWVGIRGGTFVATLRLQVDGATAYALVAAYCIGSWAWLGATPGKLVVGLRVVDRDLERLGLGRAALRFAAWTAALLPFGLPFLWVAYDSEKRGLHDRIAGTLVVTRW